MLRSELDPSELDAALDLRRALPTSSRVDILERARDALAHAREHHGTDTERGSHYEYRKHLGLSIPFTSRF